jgi:Xaa-Pro aminopeptidase
MADVPSIAPAEYGERRRRAREQAAERGLDGLLVWSRSANNYDWYADAYYLSGHYSPFPQLPDNPPFWVGRGHAAVVLPTDGAEILVVDLPDFRHDRIAIDDVRFDRDVVAATVQAIEDAGLARGRLGVVGRETMLHNHRAMFERALPGAELVAADDLLESLRLRKSDAEIAMMRHAAGIGVAIETAILEAAVPGVHEGVPVGAGFKVGCELGTQPWTVYMSSGPFSHHHMWQRLPTWDVNQVLQAGDIVHPDVFGSWEGYYYDIHRSLVVGREATDAQRAVLEAAHDVIGHMIAGIRPGVTAGAIFDRGCEWLQAHGYPSPKQAHETQHLGAGGQNFPGFGHGMGLAFEPPFVVMGEPTVLERNMVLALEIDLGPVGNTAAYEDVVVVTGDGCEILTGGCPSRWWN